MTVCDLGSARGARCLISLQCSFELSWFGCMIIYYAACFIIHIAKYPREFYAGKWMNFLRLRALASHQCGPGSIPARDHMWVEFVVGSRPCSEGFSPGSPVFLPP